MQFRLVPKWPACPAVVALAALISMTSRGVHADTLNVPADHATIQEAVDAAAAGDEILVAPGTYAGFTNNDVNMLTVRSSGGRDVTTLDGGGTATVITLGNSAAAQTTLQGFTIANGNAAITGGGVSMHSFGSSATIDDCIFLNNTSAIQGGAIGGAVLNLVITNCSFSGNSAGQLGGAVYAQGPFGNSASHIADCIFQNNTAADSGGAIVYWLGGDNTVVGCTFEDNSAPGGGAIWVLNANAPDLIDDCQFTNNSATTGNGGAIQMMNGSSVAWDFITNCTFTSNTAALSGGGVFLTFAARMTGCTLTGNTAATGGGAALSGTATADDCTFTENESTGDGGGARLVGDASIINSFVTDNIAGGNGGGAWLDNTSITASAISGNTAAGNGGGLFMISALATDCPLTGNAATGSGGAVHTEAGSSNLVNCDMSLNTAGTSGGGMYIKDGALANLSDSTICMNVPDQIDFGGLLLASNVFGCEITCPSGDAQGACCMASGECVMTTATNCIAAGGTYQGDAAPCARANCALPPAACSGDIVDSATFQPPPDGVVNAADLAFLLGAWGVCR
jgi:predicted outer membrane repeat protein